jgi:hypothetical protein
MTSTTDRSAAPTMTAALDIAIAAAPSESLAALHAARERAGADAVPITDRVRRAIELAAVGHDNQLQRSGEPYVLHPLTLLVDVAPLGESHMIVAALHDYLEDCEVDENALAFLTVDERDALDRLTHRDGDDYLTTYLDRILASPLATAVKQADLRHNLDLSRRDPAMPFTERDLDRCNKYRQALLRIAHAT